MPRIIRCANVDMNKHFEPDTNDTQCPVMLRCGLGLAAGPGLLPGLLESHQGDNRTSPYRQVGQSLPP